MEDLKSTQPDDIVTTLESANDNLRILYITFAIIIGVLLLWIIIVIFTREDPVKVLSEMTSLATQIKPVTDNTTFIQ